MFEVSEPLRVVIAICTFRRPEELLALLCSLGRSPLNCPAGRVIEVLVIDNDQGQSALSPMLAYQQTAFFPLRYVHESNRGLVAARNRALQEAGESDLLMFLDDDEWVEPNWFEELVQTLVQASAQFAVGPVRPIFPAGASSIFSKSGLFDRAEFPDRQLIKTGNTGNCCVDLRWLRSKEILFRDQFNHSGGEDAAFFAEMTQAGAIGRYAARAMVYEPVSMDRLSVSWILRRRMRYGATTVIQKIIVDGVGFTGRGLCAVEGVARATLGLVLAIAFLAVAPHRALKYSAASARGVGYVLGAFGINVRGY